MQAALGMLADGLDVWIVTDASGSRSKANKTAAIQRRQPADVSS